MKRILTLFLTAVMLTFVFAACGDNEENGTHPIIEMKVKDFGTMRIELYREYAPKTVENFVELTESGFYDGLTFHRIMKGFMVQSGDPNGNGSGGSKKTVVGEFEANGIKNELKHEKGVISMARMSFDMNSASSQFFICNSSGVNVSSLDGQYAAFGKVIEGLDVLDKISDVEVTMSMSGEYSQPVNPPVIESMKVVSK